MVTNDSPDISRMPAAMVTMASMTGAEFENTLRAHATMQGRIAAACEAQAAVRADLLQDMALASWKAPPDWRGDGSRKRFMLRVTDHVTQGNEGSWWHRG